MSAPEIRAFYLETAAGPRYALHHRPAAAKPRGSLLYVHPFAEEMNKSRRMAGVAARAFAAHGFEVLQMDLLGCGDSPGDFGDATWADWIADVRHGRAWLHAQSGQRPGLWGLRAGCLLCVEAAAELAGTVEAPTELLFWQPPASGKAVAQQFLRLRIAAQALRAPATAEAANELPAAPGDELEVAGYRVHAQLLAGLQQSQMRAPAQPTRSAWLEVTSRQPAELLPATDRGTTQWRSSGHVVHARAVAGPGFWQTQEINVVPGLLQASLEWLLEPSADLARPT